MSVQTVIASGTGWWLLIIGIFEVSQGVEQKCPTWSHAFNKGLRLGTGIRARAIWRCIGKEKLMKSPRGHTKGRSVEKELRVNRWWTAGARCPSRRRQDSHRAWEHEHSGFCDKEVEGPFQCNVLAEAHCLSCLPSWFLALLPPDSMNPAMSPQPCLNLAHSSSSSSLFSSSSISSSLQAPLQLLSAPPSEQHLICLSMNQTIQSMVLIFKDFFIIY